MRCLKLLFGFTFVLVAIGSTVARGQDQSTGYAPIANAGLKWSPLPSMANGAQIAVLHGSPAKPGLFTIRVRIPANFKFAVHRQPDERVRTIISGTYYSAIGDQFDSSKLVAFPAGTFAHVPPRTWNFAETRTEEVIFQITGIGPTGIEYLDAADDPRKPQ